MNRFSRKEFLDALFGEYFEKQDGFIMIRTAKHLDRKTSTRYFPNVEILAKEQYQTDQEVYFGISPRETMKPDKSHVRYMSVLWAGVDLGPDGYSGRDSFFSGPAPAAKAVRSFPLPPSIIVESGWGMHLYWLLRELWHITDRDRVEGLLKKIGDYFQCKNHVGLDATLRLPGTYNCKIPGKTVLCAIKYMNTDFRYHLEDFEGLRLEPQTGVSRPSRGQPEMTPAEIRANATEARAYELEDQQVEMSPELQEYMETESAVEAELIEEEVPDEATGEGQPGPIHTYADDTDDADIAPLLYESPPPCGEDSGQVMSDEFADVLADRIADRLLARVSGKLMDKLVDRIVERLEKKL